MANNNENPINRQLQAAIGAAKRGDKVVARQLLEAVLASDDKNELAWIWMASVVNTARERRVCLEKVLQINPKNERARDALNQMVGVDSNTANRPQATYDPARLEGGGASAPRNNNFALLAGVAVGVILLFVGLNLTSPTVQEAVITSTPLSAEALAVVISPTPFPTLTPNFVIIRTRDLPTLPPTFTPTPTETPTPTTFPSPTPFSLVEYGILFASRGGLEAQPSLSIVMMDGTGLQPVLENARDIAYSRTGEQIAFVRDVAYEESQEGDFTIPAGTVGELFIANINDLANARKLTELKRASVYTPTFSPSGEQIVFASDYAGNFELFLYDIPANQTSQLTTTPNGISKDPHWSPDGRRIVFTSDLESPNFSEIYVYEFVENAEPLITRITDDAGSSYSPQWSPNGRQIVYANDADGSGNIYIIGADGQRRSSLVISPFEEKNPVWSPDGRFVLFIANREDDIFQLYYAEPPNRTVTRILRDDREVSSISVRPDLLLRLVGQN